MQFRVLGAVEVVAPDGQPRPVGSPSQRRLLAALLARRTEVLSVDSLIEAVWDDDPPASAVASLRTHVSRLRPLLGEALVTRGSGYQLLAGPDSTDAGRFEQLLRAAEGAPPGEAVALLDEALALWRGPAYGDEADVPCVRAEALRLDERRTDASEQRARSLLGSGRAPEAVAAATALVEREPLREGAWATLVEALARADRPAEALRAYQRAAGALAEAGLEPSPRLRQAEQAVLDGSYLATIALSDGPTHPAADPPTTGSARPPAPAVPARAVPPLLASSFVGRDADRDQLADLLDRVRVVTLVGPGGVGKTRLALEVARVAAERRALGARVVELASLTDEQDVPAAVVAALGLAAEPDHGSDALDRAGTLDVLVVLDNAEHVVEAVAHTVERLLRGGGNLRVLVTSRERLGVDGEHAWSVAPLTATTPDASGCQLFVERARAVVGDLHLADGELVVRIVQRLDGLPLAIEMAAAQLATSSLSELADEIDRRVDALRSPRRDVAARHRSLAAVLAWSEERLSDQEATTLAELSVFAGSVAAADITGVLGYADAADITRSLAARSLVSVDRSTSPVRFQLLLTVRDFAARNLAASSRAEELAARHAAWFTGVAREADDQLRTPEELAGYQRIEATFAELRAAHRWARTHQPELALELTEHLHLYAYSRLADEPLRWADALERSRPPGAPPEAVLLVARATRAMNRGDLVAARALAEQAYACARDTPSALHALELMGDTAVYEGRVEDCIEACERSDQLATDLGDRHYLVIARAGAVMAAAYAGTTATSALEGLEATTARTDLSPSSRGWLAYTRGEVLAASDPATAFTAYDEAIALAGSVGSRLLGGVALVSSCSLRARVGDVGQALASFAEGIKHWEQLADRTHQLTTLRNLAVLLERAGEAESAAELLGAVDRQDVPTYGVEAERLAAVRSWTIDQLGSETVARLAARGAERDVSGTAQWALGVIAGLESQLLTAAASAGTEAHR